MKDIFCTYTRLRISQNLILRLNLPIKTIELIKRTYIYHVWRSLI